MKSKNLYINDVIRGKKMMTIKDVMKLFVYRPYGEKISVLVDDDERIHLKTDNWLTILDHNTGDFSFSGELHKYYEIDTISSIRDSFGDIYSIYNIIYDSIPTNTWIEVDFDESLNMEEKIEQRKRDAARKHLYYLEHRDDIRRRQRKYQRWKKQLDKEQT